MNDELTTFRTYSFVHEAELDRCLLESHGIFAFVADKTIGTAAPYIIGGAGGVRLQVKASDIAKCNEILTIASRKEDAKHETGFTYTVRKVTGLIVLVFLVAYIILAIKSFFE